MLAVLNQIIPNWFKGFESLVRIYSMNGQSAHIISPRGVDRLVLGCSTVRTFWL